MSKKLVTLTGPSCSGKTTLVRKLLKTDQFCEIVSFTSRAPRGGEVDGVDYTFLPINKCKELIDSGMTAENTQFGGNYYGITKTEILAKASTGKTPIVIVEPHGLEQLRHAYNCYTVYIDSPLEVLYSRFLGRLLNTTVLSTTIPNLVYEGKRLSNIQKEKESWIKAALPVDFYVDSYTEQTESSIINAILKAVIEEQTITL